MDKESYQQKMMNLTVKSITIFNFDNQFNLKEKIFAERAYIEKQELDFKKCNTS